MHVVVIQLLSCVSLSVTPWTIACQAFLSFTISQSLLRFMSTDDGDAIQPTHSLSSPSPPTFNLSQYQDLFNESVLCIRWAKYRTSFLAQTVKRVPTMQKTRVRSLDREGPLEKEMAIHSSTLAWKIPWMEEHGRLQSMGPQRVRYD